MKERNFELAASAFCDAIRYFNGTTPDALNNFESYLTSNFDAWLANYSDTPENIAHELSNFAHMYDITDY